MRIERFLDQFEEAAAVYGGTAAELRARDAGRGGVERWLAIDGEQAVGAVTRSVRPDDRVFLRFACLDPGAYEPLTTTASEGATGSVCTMVEADDADAIQSLEAAGFVIEIVQEAFRIRFDRALAMLRRAWLPSGFTIVSADEVNHDLLFELDNALRQDVPGTDGWRGNRDWFDEELAERPPYDPTGYLVGIEQSSRAYAGLFRMWRNPSGPRLGLIGVRRPYRRTSLAAALLAEGLEAAAQWGHDTFVTETSLSNAAVYPRIQKLGAESLGRSIQMVLT